jgi:hypothetical protein
VDFRVFYLYTIEEVHHYLYATKKFDWTYVSLGDSFFFTLHATLLDLGQTVEKKSKNTLKA